MCQRVRSVYKNADKLIGNIPHLSKPYKLNLRTQFGENRAESLSGARIFSTLDAEQQKAENAVVNTVSKLQLKYTAPSLEAAMVVADYHRGAIRAVVGGMQTHFAGFNRALNARRQIRFFGKTINLFDRTFASRTISIEYSHSNQPITINVKGSPPWQPRN